MKKPLIGIIGRSRLSDSGFNLIATPESERMAIIEHGGVPILILPTQLVEYQKCMDHHPTPGELERLTEAELNDLCQQLMLCDGILLPGGDMMFEYDRKICEYCINHDIPLLGICMGMQVMCTYNRGVCLKKINSSIQHKVLKEDYTHKVKLLPSRLKEIVKKDEIRVNSRHGYQVKNTGECVVSAKAIDSVIEAVEIPDKKFCIGVQWHPELDYHTNDSSKKLWQAFIESCKNSN